MTLVNVSHSYRKGTRVVGRVEKAAVGSSRGGGAAGEVDVVAEVELIATRARLLPLYFVESVKVTYVSLTRHSGPVSAPTSAPMDS